MAKKLAKLNIYTVFDLLYHLPFRYEDRTQALIGTLVSITNAHTKSGKVFQKAILKTGGLPATIIWFNQPFLTKTLKPEMQLAIVGDQDFFGRERAYISPNYEIVNGESIHTGRIVPIYPETAGITSKWLRTKINYLLEKLDLTDFLPAGFQEVSWSQALKTAHFPKSLDEVINAKKRLAFDELLLLQLTSDLHRTAWQHTKLTHAFSINQSQIDQFIASLPFTLTSSQNKAIIEILSDLNQTRPANRLLQGDVGSGKTVVAAVAALAAYQNGFQTLLLAPTQILAQQHYQTFTKLFSTLNLEIGLITGNTVKELKIKNSKLKIVIGTHALLSKTISFDKVGLIIIDEQHRFGVAQRTLAATKGDSPHILTMTATPIPRTIALTLYGDLDLSILTELPVGRIPVKTWVVPETKRESFYKWINDQPGQTFWVCPLIEESESLITVKAVSAEFAKLKQIFPNKKLGLLHGRLKSKDKDQVIEDFRNHKYDILVTTPVVEVGMDIPDATIMIIEDADRFGLAQLHQLRGRVGRGKDQSYCLLFTQKPSTRLKYLENHLSGQELAELDLKLRGPGEVYGTAQSGLPEFKVASYADLDLFDQARTAAVKLIPQLSQLPLLRSLLKTGKIDQVQPN